MNYRPRRPLPPGGAGWIVLGAALAPVLLQAAKPLTRKLAKGLIKAGEKLRDAVEDSVKEPPKGEEPAAPAAAQTQVEASESPAAPAPEPEPSHEAPTPELETPEVKERASREEVARAAVQPPAAHVVRPKPARKPPVGAKLHKPAKKAKAGGRTSPMPKRIKPIHRAGRPTEASPEPASEESTKRFRVPDDLDTA